MAKRIGPRTTQVLFTEHQLKAAWGGTLKVLPMLVSRKIQVHPDVVLARFIIDKWFFYDAKGAEIGEDIPSFMQCIYGHTGAIIYAGEPFRYFSAKDGSMCLNYPTAPEATKYVLGSKVQEGKICGTGDEVPLHISRESSKHPVLDAKMMTYPMSRYRYVIRDIFLTRLGLYMQFGSFKDYGAESEEEFSRQWDDNHRADKWRVNPWVWIIQVDEFMCTPVENGEILKR